MERFSLIYADFWSCIVLIVYISVPFSKQIYTVITVSVYLYSLQLINEDSDAMCKIPWNFPYIMFHICRPDIGCKFMCSVLEITLALSENIIVFIGA